MTELTHKEDRLRYLIGELASVAVAFSGGGDSTCLLAVCCEVLGAGRVLALTACSPSLPPEELASARSLAAYLGVSLDVIPTGELNHPAYVRNDEQRCFYCQHERIAAMWEVVQHRGLATLAFGFTADDDSRERPGIQAALERGVRMPLREAMLRKDEVRALALRLGLPTHDKPSLACLASRIPFGEPITAEALTQVAQAEAWLRQEVGLPQVRVRSYHRGTMARLEVETDAIVQVAQQEVRERIVARLRALGFVYVTLDLAGFRSGSMHEGRAAVGGNR
ncbi:MAG: ATP-dependent sacrificial sulfur transferase LarE [Chloroflexaceae bacterium]|nr:ATP-dependent sacrificial sulfur transferase LarE [Chloroflexaceae bacterium]